jgi:exodeoxyribonuclease-5
MTVAIHENHIWSPQQAKALADVAAWLRDPLAPQVFHLFGYAGTGKTTLAKHLAAHESGLTLFAAYTGKAASVMRAAGCEGATTLHSLMYRPFDKDRARLNELQMIMMQTPKEHPDYPEARGEYELELARVKSPGFNLNPESILKQARLLVVDEVSMVDELIARDLLSFKVKVLVLGDPAQLPPVKGGGYFTNRTPDLLLTEIHRQARDNPIVRWATMIRQGELLPYGIDGSCRKVKREKFAISDAHKIGDQILTGRNETRHMLNKSIRALKGYKSPFPQDKDRLICLMNHHGLGLLNGVTFEAHGDAVPEEGIPAVAMDAMYEGELKPALLWDADIFRGGDGHPFRKYLQADYGYAMTVHKSQGSQWPSVVLWDDGFWKREPNQRKRWLYTAITRAQERLTIVTS